MSNDFERYAAKLRGITPAMTAVLPRAARAGALVIKAEVEANAPVDEGELKRSIGDRPVEAGATSARHQVHVGAVHALWVERGHGGRHPAPAHPFFRPAFDAKEQEARERTVEVMNEALRGAMK